MRRVAGSHAHYPIDQPRHETDEIDPGKLPHASLPHHVTSFHIGRSPGPLDSDSPSRNIRCITLKTYRSAYLLANLRLR